MNIATNLKLNQLKPLPGWRVWLHLQIEKGGDTNLPLIVESDMGFSKAVGRPGFGC